VCSRLQVGGYAWWFLWYTDGPQMSWGEFTDYEACVEGTKSYSCAVFKDRHASTISMTVLVVVEVRFTHTAHSQRLGYLLAPRRDCLLGVTQPHASFLRTSDQMRVLARVHGRCSTR
jgi:hypothetical protein